MKHVKQDSQSFGTQKHPMCDVQDADVYWLRRERSACFSVFHMKQKVARVVKRNKNCLGIQDNPFSRSGRHSGLLATNYTNSTNELKKAAATAFKRDCRENQFPIL